MIHPNKRRENRKKIQNEARWITREAYQGTHYPFYNNTCSECGHTVPIVLEEWNWKCPKCGIQLDK